MRPRGSLVVAKDLSLALRLSLLYAVMSTPPALTNVLDSFEHRHTVTRREVAALEAMLPPSASPTTQPSEHVSNTSEKATEQPE